MSGRPWRLPAGIAAVLLLGGGLSAAWPGTDWLKPRIASAVQRATGRTLTIQGRLRIGWDLTVDASGVDLANMPGGSKPMMAQIGRVHARLALLPLLHGQLRVTELRLIDPRILLERDAAGALNWQLRRPAPVTSPAQPGPVRGPRWEFRLDHLTTDGGVLAWRDARHGVADGQRLLPTISADITQPAGKPGIFVGMTANLDSGPLNLEAQVDVTRQSVSLVGLHMTASSGDVEGHLTWSGGERPSLIADLTAQRLDLAALRAAAAASPPPVAALPVISPAPPTPTPEAHIISDRPLPFAAGLDRFDADIHLRVATLANPDLRDVATRLLLRDGRMTLDPFTANAGGRVDGTLQVDARQPAPAVSMTLHAPSLAWPALLQLIEQPAVVDGSLAIDANLHAVGRTPHELAATLTGTAHVASTGGALDAAAFTSLLRTAHLPSVGGEAQLRCMAVGFEAVAGQVTVTPLLLDSGRMSVQGEGHVDLDTETLAMQLRPKLRTGPGIVLPLRLTGGWRAPKLSSDLGGVLAAGGSDPCAAAPPAGTLAKSKRPKPIDLLRELLR